MTRRLDLPTATLILATVLTGLIAGFFYAYATSVSLGLARLPDTAYVRAMQDINATVRNAGFAPSFFGSALLLVVAAALHLRRDGLRGPRTVPIVLAVLLYLGGGLLLTMGVNVPMNETLATVDPTGPAVAAARDTYEDRWNAFNLARTLCSTAALACCAWALTRPRLRAEPGTAATATATHAPRDVAAAP